MWIFGTILIAWNIVLTIWLCTISGHSECVVDYHYNSLFGEYGEYMEIRKPVKEVVVMLLKHMNLKYVQKPAVPSSWSLVEKK